MKETIYIETTHKSYGFPSNSINIKLLNGREKKKRYYRFLYTYTYANYIES